MIKLIILEDSRQQESKHNIKHQWFMEHGIYWNRSALQCGDYQLPGDGSVAVDTKFSIQELVGDIQYKAMPKKEVLEKVNGVCEKYNLSHDNVDTMYHLITDDDSERFAEKEISDYCFKFNISEKPLSEFQKLYVKRHGFFHRGLVRAKNYGVKLYILVDNEEGIKSIDDLFRWVNPRLDINKNWKYSGEIIGYWKSGKPRYRKVQKFPNAMRGEQLAKACLTMQLRYNCTFLFCRPDESARKIIELLTGGKEDV